MSLTRSHFLRNSAISDPRIEELEVLDNKKHRAQTGWAGLRTPLSQKDFGRAIKRKLQLSSRGSKNNRHKCAQNVLVIIIPKTTRVFLLRL